MENLAFQKEVWTNERKPGESWFNKNSLKTRSFTNFLQEGHPTLAVDGDDDNTLNKCTIMDNYYTERPTLVIDLGRTATVGGLVLKTWQGKGQDANFAYRDYMYGLERFSVFVDKRQVNFHSNSIGNNAILYNQNASSVQNGTLASPKYTINMSASHQKARLNEYNLCNYVTRNNYAIFSSHIHLQCNKELTGRYVYIQADGRNNRWSRLFSAVLCEVQVYES